MSDLPPVSHALDDAIRRAIDSKTKPLGALGAVESLAARIARVQGTLTPTCIAAASPCSPGTTASRTRASPPTRRR